MEKTNETRWFNNSQRRKYLKSVGFLKQKSNMRGRRFSEYLKMIFENQQKGQELHDEYTEMISKKEYERLSKIESTIIERMTSEGYNKEEIDKYINSWQDSMSSNRKDYIKELDKNRTNTKSRSYQNRIRKNG